MDFFATFALILLIMVISAIIGMNQERQRWERKTKSLLQRCRSAESLVERMTQVRPLSFVYRDFLVHKRPGRWEYAHVDFDGPEDNRYGFAETYGAALLQIDEWWDEQEVDDASGR